MSHDLVNALQNILDLDIAPIAAPVDEDIIDVEAVDTLLAMTVTENSVERLVEDDAVDYDLVDQLLSDFEVAEE